jgi:hypothetical protein
VFVRSIPVVTIAALVALSAASPGRAADTRERSSRELALERARSLRVDNSRGWVEIRAGGPGRIQLTALKKSRAGDEDLAKSYASETEVEVRRESGALVLLVRYPQQGNIRLGLSDLLRGHEPPWVEVQLTLEVPADLPVTVRTASGDVTTDGLTGSQTLETSSGDVTIRKARGHVDARTASGDIEARDVGPARLRTTGGDIAISGAAGPIHARAASGDIAAHGSRDSMELRTASGDIEVGGSPRGLRASTSAGEIVVHAASGLVDLETSNGEIEVQFERPLSEGTVTSVSGDIVASLADDLGCVLDLRTSTGDIDVSLPFELATVSRHEIKGVVRGGTAKLTLKSSAGDIVLRGGGT